MGKTLHEWVMVERRRDLLNCGSYSYCMTIFCSRLLSILKDNGLPSFPLQMTPFVRLCIMKAGHFKYVRMGVCMSGRLLCLIRASRQKKAVGGVKGKAASSGTKAAKV